MPIKKIRRLARDRKGGTAIEYGLIAALVVIAMIASFLLLADTTTGMWSNVHTTIETARTAN